MKIIAHQAFGQLLLTTDNGNRAGLVCDPKLYYTTLKN